MDKNTIKVSLQVDDAKKISRKMIKRIWRNLYQNEPVPKIEGFLVSDKQFSDFENQIKEGQAKAGLSYFSHAADVKEWGMKNIDPSAGCYHMGNGFLLLVKEHLIRPLEEEIEHELKHIHDKDYEPKKGDD